MTDDFGNPQFCFQEIEYLEIRANRTVYSLKLTGRGVCPVFKIVPDFVVCRLEAKIGGFSDCSLEVGVQKYYLLFKAKNYDVLLIFCS